MSEKFKAIVLNHSKEIFTREIQELDKSFLTEGEVFVKIDYSSLNYKDALILNNGGKLVKKYPRIPGIDFSGTVISSQSNEPKQRRSEESDTQKLANASRQRGFRPVKA